jgi:hypothetical protein
MGGDIPDRLKAAGITDKDYPDILGHDPLANGVSPANNPRYMLVTDQISYQPPDKLGDPVLKWSFDESTSNLSTVGSASQDTYKVDLKLSASAGFLDFARSTLTDTSSWQWTEKSSQTSSAGTSQKASCVIGGPAPGYKGATQLRIYFDTLYKTFAFELVPVEQEQIAVEGTAVTSQGAPLDCKPVTLTQNGVKYRTFTDSKGNYHFVGNITGPVTVEAGGTAKLVPAASVVKRTVPLTVPNP